MPHSEKNLEKYIEKILQIQNSRFDKDLTDDELKHIASDMGMTETDWNEIEGIFKGHLTRAKGFINYQNWDDAIKEGEQAIILKPHQPDALYTLSYAYAKRWEKFKRPDDKEAAIKYANLCLHKDPSHNEATRLISILRMHKKTAQTQKTFSPGGQRTLPNSDTVMVLGILSIAMCWCYGLPSIIMAIITLVMGSNAKNEYQKNPAAYTDKSYKNMNVGFTCAIIGLIVSGVFILAAIVGALDIF